MLHKTNYPSPFWRYETESHDLSKKFRNWKSKHRQMNEPLQGARGKGGEGSPIESQLCVSRMGEYSISIQIRTKGKRKANSRRGSNNGTVIGQVYQLKIEKEMKYNCINKK